MALALTIADDGDGTGGTATIAGSAGGSVEVFYVSVDDVQLGTLTWISAGTRTGDGTLSVTVADGVYFSYAVEATANDVTKPVYWRATSTTKSVYEQCLDAIVARIKTVTLTGIGTGQITASKFPWKRNQATSGAKGDALHFPFVKVCPTREMMAAGAGTNAKDETQYPALVVIADRSDLALNTGMGDVLLWRERIVRAFQNIGNLPNVTETHQVTVEPGDPFARQEFQAGFDVSGLIVRTRARQTRGVV